MVTQSGGAKRTLRPTGLVGWMGSEDVDMIHALEDDSWWAIASWHQEGGASWAGQGYATEAEARPTVASAHPPQIGNSPPAAISTDSIYSRVRPVAGNSAIGHCTQHISVAAISTAPERVVARKTLLLRTAKTVSWVVASIPDFVNTFLCDKSSGLRRLLDSGAMYYACPLDLGLQWHRGDSFLRSTSRTEAPLP